MESKDIPTEEMERRIRRMSDATVRKELAFAEGFDLPDPEAVTWLYLLRVAAKQRSLGH